MDTSLNIPNNGANIRSNASELATARGGQPLYGYVSKSATNDLSSLVKETASRFGVSEFVASRLLRNLMSSGASLGELRNFLDQYSKTSGEKPSTQFFEQLQKLEPGKFNSEQEFNTALRPAARELQDKFTQHTAQANRTALEGLATADKFKQAPVEQLLSKLVTSPREFASWLVNNRAAYVMLRSNPELTYTLMAGASTKLPPSPVLLAQLSAIMAQLIKLKQGKPAGEEDPAAEGRAREAVQEAMDREHNIVSTVKNTAASVTVNPLRDFLIEAERFAEEEIANLWSLTLKKERELEKKVRKNLIKFKKSK